MIRLLVPNMPTTDKIVPYLRQIDDARWYSNFGPLVRDLENRLAARYPGAYVVTVANCTLGLQIALQVEREDGADRIGFPALTFPATALAARAAGLHVLLDDVDPDTWGDGYVSAFGAPGYGPGVIDAAGAFGEQDVPRGTCAVFSLHATKPLGCGEGGFIVTHDPEKALRYRRMTNFGLWNGISEGDGTNAKMSEYHAAVALAALDGWNREPWLQLHDWYQAHLPPAVTPQRRPRGVYSLMPVRLPAGVDAGSVGARMAAAGVETRRWYYPPLYRHPLFLADPVHFPVTEDLAGRLIGLPYHLFLTEAEVETVCRVLGLAIDGATRSG